MDGSDKREAGEHPSAFPAMPELYTATPSAEFSLMEGGSGKEPESHAFLRPEGAPQTVGSTGADEARIGKLYTPAVAGRVASAGRRAGVRAWSLAGALHSLLTLLKFL